MQESTMVAGISYVHAEIVAKSIYCNDELQSHLPYLGKHNLVHFSVFSWGP
jgi:hypothetical protein